MEVLLTLVFIVIGYWWLFGLAKRGYHATKAAYQWASTLGKDTIQILEEADPSGTQSGRLKMAVCFVRLAVAVAAADGEVSERELKAIYEFFERRGADADFMQFVTRILREAAKDIQIEKTMEVVKEVAPGDDTKLFLCAALLQIAAADEQIDKDEVHAVCAIMKGMGFSDERIVEFLKEMFGNGESEDEKTKAYSRLGLEVDANESQIREAYRRLAKQYHPDRVATLGPEFAELAHQKFIEIKSAYELLSGKSAA